MGVCWVSALHPPALTARRCVPAAGIDLENIVYYKDDTHYFVMTAKKQSLLDKGVILHVSGWSSRVSHHPGGAEQLCEAGRMGPTRVQTAPRFHAG